MKIKQVKDVVCMVIDSGLFVDTAVRLAQDYKRVYYCIPHWIDMFPTLDLVTIGQGLDGIEVVESPWPYFDEIDLWCFPGTYYGEMQQWLCDQGKAVWGSKLGEQMEIDREGMKNAMKKLKLPLQPWKSIKGLDALREHLKYNEDKWIKLSKWRGLMETFWSKDYKYVMPKLDDLEHRLGPLKNKVEFIVEDPLPDRVEIGMDAYTVDGQFPSKLMSGIEVKDKSYVGIFTDYSKLPKAITEYNAAISPLLAKFGYSGSLSTELRVGKDKEAFMIDMCCRQPSPPSEIWIELYTNLGEIFWAGANGDIVDPKPAAKYAAEVVMTSHWADKNWQPVYFPEKLRPHVKLKSACKIDGVYYVIPQVCGLEGVGAVTGFGNTLEKAIEECKKNCKEVSGFGLDINEDALDNAQKEIDKLDDIGLNFFDEKNK